MCSSGTMMRSSSAANMVQILQILYGVDCEADSNQSLERADVEKKLIHGSNSIIILPVGVRPTPNPHHQDKPGYCSSPVQ